MPPQSAKNTQQAAAQRPKNQTSESQNRKLSWFIVGAVAELAANDIARRCNQLSKYSHPVLCPGDKVLPFDATCANEGQTGASIQAWANRTDTS